MLAIDVDKAVASLKLMIEWSSIFRVALPLFMAGTLIEMVEELNTLKEATYMR